MTITFDKKRKVMYCSEPLSLEDFNKLQKMVEILDKDSLSDWELESVMPRTYVAPVVQKKQAIPDEELKPTRAYQVLEAPVETIEPEEPVKWHGHGADLYKKRTKKT